MVSDGSRNEIIDHNPRRKVQFADRLDRLRTKLACGGGDHGRLNPAGERPQNNLLDFPPLAAIWVASLKEAIEHAKAAPYATRDLTAAMLRPALKLKDGAELSGHPLIARLADTLIRFLQALVRPDRDALDVVVAFHAALDAVVTARITGFGAKHSGELLDGLVAACRFYFKHHPQNRSRR